MAGRVSRLSHSRPRACDVLCARLGGARAGVPMCVRVRLCACAVCACAVCVRRVCVRVCACAVCACAVCACAVWPCVPMSLSALIGSPRERFSLRPDKIFDFCS